MDRVFEQILNRAIQGGLLNREEIARLLAAQPGEEQAALYAAADIVRRQTVGDEVHLRGIIEFSNHCRRNCLYCGLRRDNRDLERYRIGYPEIFEIARGAAELGYRTVVLQSGEDPWYEARPFAELIRKIKSDLGMAVTLSVGERDARDYALWREAGADRYLLKHETADPELFHALRPGTRFEERLRCLRTLRALGYQIGAGNIIGLPGQSLEGIAEDILLMQELAVDMAGIGPFIPHPATPLAEARPGSVELTLNCVAAARLALRRVHLPATTALGTLDPLGRQKALCAGANVVMPNITPKQYRRRYQIYPSKICLDDEPEACQQCITGIIQSLGRTVATDYGHSPRWLAGAIR